MSTSQETLPQKIERLELENARLHAALRDLQTTQRQRNQSAASPTCHDQTIVEDISDRKQVEAALCDSEERYRSLMEQAADGIFIADSSGRYIDVNSSGCRMTGYSHPELLQMSIADLVTDEEVGRIAPALDAMKQGETHLGEWQFRRKDGSTFPGEVSGIALSDGRVLGLLRDITARKQAEETLKRQNARLHEQASLLELVYAAILVRDMQDRITFWNQGAEEKYGWTKAEAQGQVVHTFLKTQFFLPQKQIEKTLRDCGRWQGELVHTRRNGTQIVVESRQALLRDEQGQPVAIMEINRDITAQKQTEKALRESESRARATFEMSADGIITMDERGIIHAINPAATHFFGYEAAEVVGQNITLLMPEPYRSEHTGYLERYCRTGEKHIIGIGREVVGQRKDGTVFPLALTVGEMRLQGERLFVGSLRDITAQKILQEQLFAASKLESLGRLAGGIAHDFNNLLTAITGYAGLAQMELPPDTQATQYLRNIAMAAERAAALTQQLLMYARRQMVEFTSVNQNEVIHRMTPLLRRTIGEAYDLVFALSASVWNVYTNASQMEQMLMNLVLNARDSMPTGGRIVIETVNVTLDAEYAASHVGVAPGDYVMFSVSDSGTGMPPEVQQHIFEPFFSTKEMHKGTGLGLATCYGIVKQSQGNIWVYSESGQGTTFKVYLPRIRQVVAPSEAPPPNSLATGTETILLVDDEPMVRDVAARALRAQGYRVLEARGSEEALQLQTEWKEPIDLLVTDVVMPAMSGKELTKRMQQLRSNMKVLYMSGYTHNVILQQGVLDPDVELITKPFTATDIANKVREILNRD